MKFRRVALVLMFASLATAAFAQSPVASLTLGPDIIGKVRTAPAITTKISFPEKVIEVICGDLYDPASGKGSFVLQTSGNDVFLKPVVPKGVTNMFVKTGDDGKHTYNFDLEIVPVAQAHRIVNVQMAVPAAPPQTEAAPGTNGAPDSEAAKTELNRLKAQIEADAQQEANQIIRKAQQQADRITAEADAKVIEMEKQAVARSAQAVEDRFVQALMLGLREYKVNDSRTSVKKIVVQMEPRVLAFDEKSFLRYTITNNSEADFNFSGISLEVVSGKETKPITIRVVQSKSDNRLDPGETLNGVIVFDSKQVLPKDKLALFIRGEDSAEIARVVIQ
ncbi:MAG TPA: TrbG/VirB9 family P-type conjugative transfer protein [Blastocatellia bacterium]|nr:TrbG/VirB9 family P-type conjugative transfer protein [Blastocatellia bacterium]